MREKPKPRGMVAVALVLGLFAVGSGIGGLILLNTGRPGTTAFEIGKWLLQLATVFAGTGVIAAVLRQAEVMRAKRESWTGLLQEVIAAHDTVLTARLLLEAHATAKTYTEQIEKFVQVRAVLRRIASSPDLHDMPELRRQIVAMQEYLIKLGREYEREYLPVARQQRLDEEVLSFQLKELAKESKLDGLPVIPPVLAKPLPAGRQLADEGRFAELTKFRKDFDDGEFRQAYKEAKRLLESAAGIKRSQT